MAEFTFAVMVTSNPIFVGDEVGIHPESGSAFNPEHDAFEGAQIIGIARNNAHSDQILAGDATVRVSTFPEAPKQSFWNSDFAGDGLGIGIAPEPWLPEPCPEEVDKWIDEVVQKDDVIDLIPEELEVLGYLLTTTQENIEDEEPGAAELKVILNSLIEKLVD